MFAIMPEMPNAKLDSPRRHLIGYWHLFQHLETAGLTWRSGAVGLITSLKFQANISLSTLLSALNIPQLPTDRFCQQLRPFGENNYSSYLLYVFKLIVGPGGKGEDVSTSAYQGNCIGSYTTKRTIKGFIIKGLSETPLLVLHLTPFFLLACITIRPATMKSLLSVILAFILAVAMPATAQTQGVSTALLNRFIQMATICMSTYVGDTCVAPDGLVKVADITNTATDVHGWILRDDVAQEIIVAFRGTLSIQNYDSDTNYTLANFDTSPSCAGCQVHGGYYLLWVSVYEDVQSLIQSQVSLYPDYGIVITGHR